MLALVTCARGESPARASHTDVACGAAPAKRSRWGGAQPYHLTHEFGNNQREQWLGGIQGIAVTSGGEVLVYDAPESRVVVLSSDLAFQRSIGRAGRGPGELASLFAWNHQYLEFNYLATNDSIIYVSDGRRIHMFTLGGSFMGYVPALRPGDLMFQALRSIHAGTGSLYYAVDSLDFAGRAQRRFQVWAVAGTEASKLVEWVLPDLPVASNGAFTNGPTQARPLSTQWRSCIFFSDGESEVLLRYSLVTGRLDSVPLPHHRIPKLDAAMIERQRRGMAELGAMSGTSGRVDMPEPTAKRRWAELAVDPDGHVWINPWLPRGEAGQPVGIYRVNPESTDWTQDTMPAFPHAFGEPGVFYTALALPTDDTPVVRRYAREGR